ncbi:hypothetical protein D3C75_1282680 [compost metagenome]
MAFGKTSGMTPNPPGAVSSVQPLSFAIGSPQMALRESMAKRVLKPSKIATICMFPSLALGRTALC